MKRLVAVLCLLALLAACAPPAQQQPTSVAKAAPTLAPAAAALPAAQAASQAQATVAPGNLDQLVAKAKQEGTVVVYATAGQAMLDRLTQGFEKTYGIKVDSVVLASAAMAQRFETDLKAGNASDILQYTDELHAQDLIKRGEVMQLGPQEVPSLAQWPQTFYNGYYAKFSIVTPVIFYNTKLVPPAQAPKDWPDLLKPEWKGKFTIWDPRASPVSASQYFLWRERYGDDFLRKLAAQEPKLFTNPNPAAQSVAAGDVPIQAWGYGYITIDLKSKGAPVDEVEPSFAAGAERLIMVAAKAKHPNAAKLFLHYSLSADGQEGFNGKYQGASPLANVPTAAMLPKGYVSVDLSLVKQAEGKIKELMNLP